MNEFEDIDRVLEEAFTQRPTALSRPSLRDVKRRARRHQRQRSAGVLSACAIVGVGGAAVLATRSPASQTTVGEGLDPTVPAICFPVATTIGVYDATTVPLNTAAMTTVSFAEFYVLQAGDNPTSVASMFGVTLDELNALNASTLGYDIFFVGLEIRIPEATFGTTTTMLGDASDEGIQTLYVLVEGDYPKAVADAFGVTVDELNTANVNTSGYADWLVGTPIRIPFPSGSETTTTGVAGSYAPDPTAVTEVDCVPAAASTLPGDTTLTTISFSATTFVITKIGTVIQVGNCSNQEGVARYLSDQLANEAFTMTEPDTCTIDLPVTKIIYNPDDPAALSVARSLALFLANAVVEASGPEVPLLATGTWAEGSSVIVLLGDDLAGKTLAQIAQSETSGTSTTYPNDTGATVTTCIIPPQMTLPPPATTTSMPGSC